MWLGIDLGTGSVKALLLAEDGSRRGEGGAPCPVDAPRAGWSESDPEAWWEAVQTAVAAALEGGDPAEVRAVGLSGQMHGVVLADADGAPQRPAVLWSDARSGAQLERYRALPDELRAALANPLVVGMAGPTLLWLAEHEPGAPRAARWALQPKDWLRLRLTGAAGAEPSDASATLLYDLPADGWAGAVLDALELPAELLPPLGPSAAVAGELTTEAADALGLRPGTPVAAGAADTAAAIEGSGLEPGDAQLTVGSGAQIVVVQGAPEAAPERGLHLYRAAREARWYRMAAMQNAGLALERVRSLLGLDWPAVYAHARRAPPGSDGLVFLPYLTGERTPHLNPDARGGWVDLGRHHDRDHMARAALEGVAFAVADGFEALGGAAAVEGALRLAGGGTREPFWRQLLADALGAPLRPADATDASARGAARRAAASQGEELPPLRAGSEVVEPGEPDERLERARARFGDLYARIYGA